MIRLFSTIKKAPITITDNAWNKMSEILKNNKNYSFLFSAKGGGCNGFNYNLESINKKEFDEMRKMSVLENNSTKLIIDPMSEFLLLGTNIDYIKEDYSKNIFESKFIFTPQKNLASTCGCGVSFTPKKFN
jgi:iron-sulfur cluster assembly accessory protein